MSSTTYNRFANLGKLYVIRKHFVDVNKMVHHLGTITAMVRNAGQLPQPFWLGGVHGGGSCSTARCSART